MYALEKFSKGEVVLFPVVDKISKIIQSDNDANGQPIAMLDGDKFLLEKIDQIENNENLCGFWWVNSTDDKKLANMTVRQKHFKSCSISITRMENHTVVFSGQPLLFFKPPKERPATPGTSNSAKKIALSEFASKKEPVACEASNQEPVACEILAGASESE